MIYLFIHQNFPGQYQHIVRHLAQDPANTVYFVSQPNTNWVRNVIKIAYNPERPAQLICHPYTIDFDLAVRNGVAVVQSLQMLRSQGVRPDIIVGHSGWGETLFVKDVYPDVPLLAYMEFFYHHAGVDTGFDNEFQGPPEDAHRLRMKNSVNFLSMDAADWGQAPTLWQHGLYPPELRMRMSVLHEGVDTAKVKPDPDAWLQLKRDNRVLTRNDEVITYVARNLEPYRGFHVFMRALPEIMRRRPKAQILIVGGDDVSYGCAAPPGTTYREVLTKEVEAGLDMSRIHFLGQLPYDQYLNLLQISSAHVYLTYPFVLSWSFLEAMSAGCAIVGSATPPVLEVLRDGHNGLATDFFSAEELADQLDRVLDDRDLAMHLREGARETAVSGFDLESRQIPLWMQLFQDLIEGRKPETHLSTMQAMGFDAPKVAGINGSANSPAKARPKVNTPRAGKMGQTGNRKSAGIS
jgi:glycosyltransferase involved in cell wall biosynthesis